MLNFIENQKIFMYDKKVLIIVLLLIGLDR